MRKRCGVLLLVFVFLLTSCAGSSSGTQAVPLTHPAADQPSKSDGSSDAHLPFELQLYSVKNTHEIGDVLVQAIRDLVPAVKLDLSSFSEPLQDTYTMMMNTYFGITADYPQLKYAYTMVPHYSSQDRTLLCEIKYMPYKTPDQTIVLDEGVYIHLNKSEVVEGDLLSVSLFGSQSDRCTLAIGTSNSSAAVDGEIISFAQSGTVELSFTVTDVQGNAVRYEESIAVLPKDVPKVNTLRDLLQAAEGSLDKNSQPVMIFNPNLDVDTMQKALQQVGGGYIVCTLNTDGTEIRYAAAAGQNMEECRKALRATDQLADGILASLIKDPMTDTQKLTVIYDYVVANTRYDYRYYSNKAAMPFESTTAYGCLKNGLAICGGYAHALKLMLTKVGIECYTVAGKGSGQYHMWNVARIDGNLVNLDATFESANRSSGLVSHAYFCVSDESLRANHQWDETFLKVLTETMVSPAEQLAEQ